MFNKTLVNRSFEQFLEEKRYQKPTTYRKVVKNPEAGFKSCSKYDRTQPEYDRDAWGLACTWARNHFCPFVRGSRNLTEDEAITELDKTTSCGFPWSLEHHNKREMLDTTSRGIIPWYWTEIASNEEQSYHPIWTCTQKVELRDVEKLAENKVRTFTAAPIEHTVALTRLCLDFNNRFYAAKETWSFVGRTKYFQGWNKMVERMRKHGEGIDSDASSFDSSLFQEALMDQFRMRWECMADKTPANYQRLLNCYKEIIWSVIVMENGELLWKDTGNPSGSANTIVDNTMILFRILAYCWIRECPPAMRSYSVFMSKVEGVLNGDDNNVSVAKECRSFYNSATIRVRSAELGVVMTTEHEDFTPVELLSFLSHRAVRMLDLWLPSPNTEKVLASMLYGSDLEDVRWHFLRATALLIDSWANLECRRVLSEYLDYLSRKHSDEFVGEVNGMSMPTIFANMKSNVWCSRLYAGFEGASEQGVHLPLEFVDNQVCCNDTPDKNLSQ